MKKIIYQIKLGIMLVAVLIIPLGMVTSYADDDNSGGRKCKPVLQFGQSPIDITDDCLVKKRLPKLQFWYGSGDVLGEVCLEVANGELTPNGTEIVPEFVASVHNLGHLRVCSDVYHLKSFHWHTPAEHLVNGVAFPMELHLVHEHVRTGDPLVVAVLYVEGAHNDAIDPIFSRLVDIARFNFFTTPFRACVPRGWSPGGRGPQPGIGDFDLEALLPPKDERTTFRYGGSFTTANPDGVFEEGVRWIVMTEPVEASQEQIDSHKDIVGDAPGTGDLLDINFTDVTVEPPRGRPPVTDPIYDRPFPEEGNARVIQDKDGRKVFTEKRKKRRGDHDSDSDD